IEVLFYAATWNNPGRGGVDDGSGARWTDATSARDALVRSRFRRRSGGTVRVDWRVAAGEGQPLQLVDVYVNGVSRFVIRRDEFQALVKAKGMAGLLAELRSGALAGR
ncbi:MAG: ABC transporter substrate-binding protein, partial [Thermaurantiacus tibetensis]